MARKWSNLNLPGVLHFVTGNVVHRIPIFKQDRRCLQFLQILKEQVDEWPSKLIAYVIMPDHFHLIVNPHDGAIRAFCGALKSLTAKAIVDVSGDKRFVLEKPDKEDRFIRCGRKASKHFRCGVGG